MSTTPKRYRKKPVEIQAIQWIGDDWGEHIDAMLEFTDEVHERDGKRYVRTLFMSLSSDDADDVLGEPEAHARMQAGYSAVVYDDLHGTWVNVSTGDWIIKGLEGEFYPCTAQVFAATYDEVTEQ